MGFFKKLLKGLGITAGVGLVAGAIAKNTKQKKEKFKEDNYSSKKKIKKEYIEEINEEEYLPEYYCPNCKTDLELQKGFSPDRKYWKCLECGQELYGDGIYEGERFPGIMWHCDECGALLNIQKDFTDLEDEWECQGCGHINPIEDESINETENNEEDCEELELLGECVDCNESIYEDDDYCEECWKNKFSLEEYNISSIINEIDSIRNEIINKLTEINSLRDEIPDSTGTFYTNSITEVLDDLEETRDVLQELDSQIFESEYGNRTVAEYKDIKNQLKEIKEKYNYYSFNNYELTEIINNLKNAISYEDSYMYTQKNKYSNDGFMCKKCLNYTKNIPSDSLCVNCKKEYLEEMENLINDMESILNKISNLFLGLDI